MVAYRLVFLAGAVAALPLNINLGAYSPAIVVGKRGSPSHHPLAPSLEAPKRCVQASLLTSGTPTGDGEISFGGNQDVSKLMTTLEGAAVTAANGAAANTAAQGQAQGGTGAAAGKTEGAAQAPAAGQQPQAAAVGQPQAASLEQNQSEPAAIPATTSGSTTDTTLTDQVSFDEVRILTTPDMNREANQLPPPMSIGSANRCSPGHGQGRRGTRRCH